MGRFVSESTRPTNTARGGIAHDQSRDALDNGSDGRTRAFRHAIGPQERADEGGVAY